MPCALYRHFNNDAYVRATLPDGTIDRTEGFAQKAKRDGGLEMNL
jgi:hypothetical protein